MATHTRKWLVTGALLLASAAMAPRNVVEAQTPPQPAPPAAPAAPAPSVDTQLNRPGRVVATVTALEGSVHVPGVEVELQAEDGMAIARTVSDTTGQVTFPDVPPGRYRIRATRLGFGASDSAAFNVRRGETTQVLVDISLTFVAPGVEVVSAPPAAKTPPPTLPAQTMTVQPVSASDMMSGNVLDLAPLPGDDFQSLLPMLPGVVRGPDGRLRIKGGQPTQGALQVSSASLVDPSTGDFDLQLPGQSVETVEVLANPFAAEYGRFSTSVTQIRTTRGTNDWAIKPGNLVPRFRGNFSGLRAFEPRFSIRGPLKRDRLFLSQDLQFRYVATPVRSLPDEPEINLKSFDLFTRLDGVISSRHTLGGGFIMFPREVEHLTMDTFRPKAVTPDLNQSGAAAGLLDRFALAADVVLETTVAVRSFEVNVNTGDESDPANPPMTYAPETQSGMFFNDQEREVHSFQWVEAVTVTRNFSGEHLFKFGTDLQISGYDGTSLSRPLESRRLDGSLAERVEFVGRIADPSGGPGAGASTQEVNGTEFSIFAQDRWRVSSRMTLELGFRMDRDDVVEKVNWSPRAGVSLGVLPDGRGILRGGVGKFLQRTPLNIGAFGQFETRLVTRYAPDGTMIGSPLLLRHVTDSGMKTPEGLVGNVEWDQRFGRRVIVKANYLRRHGSHEYILNPEPENGLIRLSSAGESRYWEFETTARYLGSGRKDITVSYVRSHGTADLNNYDSFYGNLRTPFLRPNENNLIPHDVPNRILVRGVIGLLSTKWDVAPVLELRSGFPWSAVNEFQDFVGPRSRAGRMPKVTTFDVAVTRPFRFKKYTFRAGIRAFNLFGASADRDVQANTTSPNFGQFYNPIERSIGIVLGSQR